MNCNLQRMMTDRKGLRHRRCYRPGGERSQCKGRYRKRLNTHTIHLCHKGFSGKLTHALRHFRRTASRASSHTDPRSSKGHNPRR
jgi:hypothetical protein